MLFILEMYTVFFSHAGNKYENLNYQLDHFNFCCFSAPIHFIIFFIPRVLETLGQVRTLYACVCSVTPLCLTLLDPMDCCPPGSSVNGVVQARILVWVAISNFTEPQFFVSFILLIQIALPTRT